MMIHMTTVGGVTADIEGKESANGATYLSFDLAVTKGYGTSRHTVYLQVWAFRAIAERLIAAKVRKGVSFCFPVILTLLHLSGRMAVKGR